MRYAWLVSNIPGARTFWITPPLNDEGDDINLIEFRHDEPEHVWVDGFNGNLGWYTLNVPHCDVDTWNAIVAERFAKLGIQRVNGTVFLRRQERANEPGIDYTATYDLL